MIDKQLEELLNPSTSPLQEAEATNGNEYFAIFQKGNIKKILLKKFAGITTIVNNVISGVNSDGSTSFTGIEAFGAGLKTDTIQELTTGADTWFKTGIKFSSVIGVSATGTNQSTAFQLTKTLSMVQTINAGVDDGVRLVGCTNGGFQAVMNYSNQWLTVYPTGSNVITSGAGFGSNYVIPPYTLISFYGFIGGYWVAK